MMYRYKRVIVTRPGYLVDLLADIITHEVNQ